MCAIPWWLLGISSVKQCKSIACRLPLNGAQCFCSNENAATHCTKEAEQCECVLVVWCESFFLWFSNAARGWMEKGSVHSTSMLFVKCEECWCQCSQCFGLVQSPLARKVLFHSHTTSNAWDGKKIWQREQHLLFVTTPQLNPIWSCLLIKHTCLLWIAHAGNDVSTLLSHIQQGLGGTVTTSRPQQTGSIDLWFQVSCLSIQRNRWRITQQQLPCANAVLQRTTCGSDLVCGLHGGIAKAPSWNLLLNSILVVAV